MEAGHEIAGPAANTLQAAQCALAFLQDYRGPEKDQIPFQILKALAETTAERLRAGVRPDNVRLDARELTEFTLNAAPVRGPAAGKENVWISKYWKKLEQLLEETRGTQEEVARRERIGFTPALHKDQSKGGQICHRITASRRGPCRPEAQSKSSPFQQGGSATMRNAASAFPGWAVSISVRRSAGCASP